MTLSSVPSSTKPILLRYRVNTVKIIAGGAALKQSSAEYLHVDYVADTAFDGLRYIRNIISVPTFN